MVVYTFSSLVLAPPKARFAKKGGSVWEPPFFANRAFGGGGGLKVANRSFEAIGANRLKTVICNF